MANFLESGERIKGAPSWDASCPSQWQVKLDSRHKMLSYVSTSIPGCDDSLCIPVVFMHLGGDFCIRKLHCSLPSSRMLFNQTSEFLWAEIPEKHPTIQNLELDRLDQKLVKNSVTFFATKYGFSNDLFKLLKFWCCRKKVPTWNFQPLLEKFPSTGGFP